MSNKSYIHFDRSSSQQGLRAPAGGSVSYRRTKCASWIGELRYLRACMLYVASTYLSLCRVSVVEPKRKMTVYKSFHLRINIILLSFLTLCLFSCSTQHNINKSEDILTLTNSINTSSKMVSVQMIDANNKHFGYVAGETKTTEAYAISNKGKLELIEEIQLTKKSGGARAITNVKIGNTNLLLLGNKADNALEVYRINNDGTLERLNAVFDTEEIYIDEIVTIEAVQLDDRYYVYAGGLDEGFSCFELSENGDLNHVQSIADTESLFLHGIIGMSSLVIENKRFLITGAFFDGGVSSFEIMEDGKLKNVDNVIDDGTLFLNGTFPIETVQLGDLHYLLVGHRHNIHYTANAENEKEYHGDGVNVFKIDANGKMKLHSLLKDDEALRLKGSTRIELIKVNNKKALVFIATRDDTGIQVCSLEEDGILRPITSIDVGYAIYNGMDIKKINDKWYLLAGAYDGDMLESYSIKFDY